MSRLTVACAAVLLLAGYTFVYAAGRADQPIRADGFSYYVYLPSWFIFHDPSLAATARDCCGGEFPTFTAINRWPGTRRWVNAHPIGVAVMQAPLFLVADALTRWTNLSRDGFTLYYQHAAGLSGLLWILAGLWVLRGLLRRHFTDGVTAATLIALLLGTNLYHYGTFDSSYSHASSFFLVAALMDLSDRWHAGRRRPVLLGLVIGLLVLVRHTNALFVLIPLLHGIDSLDALRARGAALKVEWRALTLVAATAAIVVLPQAAIYYAATGRVLVSSYGELGFNWGSPQLAGVLFSVRKGLFFWSPLLLAALAGLLLLARSRHAARAFVVPAVAILAVDTYLIASWWDWQFGGSYGHRGFVDALPLFAVGLAGFLTWAAGTRVRRTAAILFVAWTVSLSAFQMLQYWNGVLPYNDLTWDRYRATFLRLR